MKREEAIKGLTSLVEVRRKYVGMQTMKDEIECLEMAIQALEQEPCEDCVRRQAVLDCAVMAQIKGTNEDGCITRNIILVDEVKTLPSVNPKSKTGHWIIKDGKEQGYDIAGIKTWYIQIMCDKCGFIKTAIEGHTGQYHYCPHCGARMVEPQERSDKE